jgi:hypothetical protein
MQAPLFRLPLPFILDSALFGEYRPTWHNEASIVGQYENPVPDMRGTNGGSRYAMPFRIVPDLGQRPENSVQSPSKQRCHVFQHNCSRSQFANHAKGLKEQSTSLSIQSCPRSGVGNILAGEASADNVDCFEAVTSALSDVAFSVDVRPMLFKDFRCVVVNFHLPFAGHSSPLET